MKTSLSATVALLAALATSALGAETHVRSAAMARQEVESAIAPASLPASSSSSSTRSILDEVHNAIDKSHSQNSGAAGKTGGAGDESAAGAASKAASAASAAKSAAKSAASASSTTRSAATSAAGKVQPRHPAWPGGRDPDFVLGAHGEVAVFGAKRVTGHCDDPRGAFSLGGRDSFLHVAAPRLARLSASPFGAAYDAAVAKDDAAQGDVAEGGDPHALKRKAAGATGSIWVRPRRISASHDATIVSFDLGGAPEGREVPWSVTLCGAECGPTRAGAPVLTVGSSSVAAQAPLLPNVWQRLSFGISIPERVMWIQVDCAPPVSAGVSFTGIAAGTSKADAAAPVDPRLGFSIGADPERDSGSFLEADVGVVGLTPGYTAPDDAANSCVFPGCPTF